MRYTLLSLTAGATLALGLLAGCDSVDPIDQAPAVPPAEAFQMDTDFFNAASKAAAAENFGSAKLRVGIVSALVHVHLIVPHLVTAAALQAEPELVEGRYVWSSTTTHQGRDVSFTLTGTPSADESTASVDWSVRISGTDPETEEPFDFELYTATTSRDHASGEVTGTWELFYPIEGERTNVLDAEFTVTSPTEKEITFSVPEGGEHAGDSVRYARSGEERTFEWTQVAEETTTLVTWNVTTKAGALTITSPEGVEQSCWDADLGNIECAN